MFSGDFVHGVPTFLNSMWPFASSGSTASLSLDSGGIGLSYLSHERAYDSLYSHLRAREQVRTLRILRLEVAPPAIPRQSLQCALVVAQVPQHDPLRLLGSGNRKPRQFRGTWERSHARQSRSVCSRGSRFAGMLVSLLLNVCLVSALAVSSVCRLLDLAPTVRQLLP